MSLGVALSGLLNQTVAGLDHRVVFEILDLAGIQGEVLHYAVLAVSVVWGLHDIILRDVLSFGDS